MSEINRLSGACSDGGLRRSMEQHFQKGLLVYDSGDGKRQDAAEEY